MKHRKWKAAWNCLLVSRQFKSFNYLSSAFFEIWRNITFRQKSLKSDFTRSNILEDNYYDFLNSEFTFQYWFCANILRVLFLIWYCRLRLHPGENIFFCSPLRKSEKWTHRCGVILIRHLRIWSKCMYKLWLVFRTVAWVGYSLICVRYFIGKF